MARTFSFIGHPAYPEHLQRYLEWCRPGHKAINPRLLTKVFEWTPAYLVRDLDEVRSATGATRAGMFVTATLLPEMENLSPLQALQKVIDACVLSDRLGARISTLGGHTSIAGALAPQAIARAVKSSVTTGNTFTSAMAVQQVHDIAALAGLPLQELTLTVLGGAGDIGSTCAELLAPHFQRVTLTGRTLEKLRPQAERIKQRAGVDPEITTDNKAAVSQADVVIAATSASKAILDADHFKPGTLVSDIGYPKNVRRVVAGRDDILVYLGGVCRQDHPVEFGYDIDLPRKDLLYGCFAEALVLDFEENYTPFSTGRGNITPDKVAYMLEKGARHGYRPAPPCQYDEYLDADEIKRILGYNPKWR
ncbi:MAG: hypothetical protein FJ125_01595 [Deltaproteobacteria bacterium]|nr:hypothetical protein [Deltaproteobacteria bacterium]